MIARLAEIATCHRRVIVLLVVAMIAAIGFAALHVALRTVHLRDVRHALAAVPAWRIAAASGLTVVSYLALTCYDVIALRVIGRPQRWSIAATGSFTSYTISHNLGLAILTGGSARYRVYTAAGLSFGEIAQVTAIAGVTFWGGVLAAGGLALTILPSGLTFDAVTIAGWQTHAIGLAILATLAVLLLVLRRQQGALRVGGMRLPLPDARQLLALAAVTLIDLGAASAALFVLVPQLGADSFPYFLIAYILAIVTGLVTHVPGGLGVFEAVMLAMVPSDHPAVFAGLLLYRILYYLLPLLVAGGMIALAEGKRLHRPIGTGLSLLDRAARAMAPTAVTVLVFVGGFVLLVSGALPGAKPRLGDLNALLPLPFIEGSHLAGSLIGTALLLVAPALNARLRSGMYAARVLLIGGAVFSLTKGLDYEEAAVMLAIAGLLHYCRRAFYRQGGIANEPLDWAWLAAAAAAVTLSLWAGFFAYKRTAYADDLWWHFALNGNAPRFLRASFGAGILVAATAFWHLLAGRHRVVAGEIPEAAIVRALPYARRSDANLAFTGDKSFIVSAVGDAFLMYRVQGQTWVVMGDPVGPASAWSELVWAIRRACDAARGRLCFYQASAAMLPLFVDLGLNTIKYGEEATVSLTDFTVAGPRGKTLRHSIRRAEAAGLDFAIVPAAAVPALLLDLRHVSDLWLADKGGREKQFSLGCFDPAYLSRFDLAVVRDGDRIVAFANIWVGGDGQELSVDLMRHRPDAPYGTMDLLFTRLLEWGRAAGFQRFNLGLAPLAGIEGNRLAPVWARIAHLLFENGERLYAFAGLRAFKAKYASEWTPRYIATPRGLGMVRSLSGLVRIVTR